MPELRYKSYMATKFCLYSLKDGVMFHQEYFPSEEQAVRERNAKEAEAKKAPEEKLEYKVEQEPRKRSFPEKRPQAETISGKKAHRDKSERMGAKKRG
jgi:hypothetical protein